MSISGNILVVLGYPADDSGQPSPILKARLDKAIELYKKGQAEKVILTGAAVDNKYVESDVMADYCRLHGIPEQDILKESDARNTYENARMVKRIMHDMGYKKALVVTSSFHKMRAELFFSRQMDDVQIVAAPFPTGFSLAARAFLMLKEYIIIILYKLGLLNGRYSIQQHG